MVLEGLELLARTGELALHALLDVGVRHLRHRVDGVADLLNTFSPSADQRP